MTEPEPTTEPPEEPAALPSATAPVLAFCASAAAAVGLAIVYSVGGQPQVEGALLAIALGGIGVGLVSWSRRFMPDDVAVEDRGTVASDPDAVQALLDDLGAEKAHVGRRHLLVRMLAVAGGALGVAALFPIRSLGPRPGRGLHTTPYSRGDLRLVSEAGDPVHVDELAVNGLITVFPEGYAGQEDSQTLLINLPEGELDPRPGREDWTVGGLVAFSKVCTHAGCPVGLYEEQTAQLLCPCHQSTFDVKDAARPVFGPATRSLPQLPLGTDDEGYLIATGDFSGPVGPGFWDHDPLILRRLLDWADSRTGVAGTTRRYVDKVFPNQWSFLLGEVTLYCFIILVATGTWLAFFFQPSTAETVYDGSYAPLQGVVMSKAYASALDLSFDVRAGLVMRQMHHWAALLFVAAMTAHLARVFFTGAFRRPRELNWMIGVVLLILAIVNGFAGYSLLDDQLSGTGLRIAYSVALSIPLAGTWMASLFFGGDFPGDQIISRLFVIHVYLVPIVIGILLSAHLALVVAHKHTQFAGEGAREDNVVGERLWPTYAAKAGGLFFLVAGLIALLGGLAQINPIWVYGPFRPANVSTLSQPDWYMGWLEGAMRLMPPWEIRAFGFEVPNPFFPGVLIPGITFGMLLIWPFLEARFSGDHAEHHILDRPRDRPLRTALGVATLAFYTVLGLGGASDALSTLFDISVNRLIWTLRVLVIVVPIAAGFLTRQLCLELQRRDGPVPSDEPVRSA